MKRSFLLFGILAASVAAAIFLAGWADVIIALGSVIGVVTMTADFSHPVSATPRSIFETRRAGLA